MNIALFGYGRMGHEVEKVAVERGHHVVYINNGEPIDWQQLRNAQVAIEFSQPNSAWSNIKQLLDASIPVVCGTTGWLEYKPEADALAKECHTGFLYASNFSLGVNLFFAFNEKLAQWMAPHKDYIPAVHEIHHTGKKDAPSGTAITAAEGILSSYPEMKGWSMDENPSALPITAERKDPYFGTHIVSYNSPVDSIRLEHEAHSRKGFALGAVLAAEWIPGRTGSFNMRDVLGL